MICAASAWLSRQSRRATSARLFRKMATFSMRNIEFAELLAVAEVAARRAGQVLKSERQAGRNTVDHEKASSQDLVTAADVAAQLAIFETVSAAFPFDVDSGRMRMLGEEDVEPGSAASTAAIARMVTEAEYLFVVDPLDGTTMYAHDIPLYTVSIGVAWKGVVVAGVVYEPNRDEMFTATRGAGARLNGVLMTVSPETRMRNALWGFGLHSFPPVTNTMLRALTGLCQVSRGCRCLGSAALHLAYVAAGRLTGFTELDLNSWDLAAGSLLVEEAGGRVTDTRLEPYSLLTRDVLATCGAGEVHEGARIVLQAMGADKPDGVELHTVPGAGKAAFDAWVEGEAQ